ncbi:hypothetical protein K443DRAFT_652006 [Laccaria amethystina LaAM-08-1]|uniref:Uncharacterized protein n=1 Tax=Laccaria amethystina LaAM-08-1 TaxID=1095629 RepID=A0A0C9XQ81_9AGAR|nr:hypothetical protein K443DRAFT_652006 [Laccaria amethystina LaAM-08-1]
MISLAFDPFAAYPLAFFIFELTLSLPFRRPLLRLIPFRTRPATLLSLFNNLPISEFLVRLRVTLCRDPLRTFADPSGA